VVVVVGDGTMLPVIIFLNGSPCGPVNAESVVITARLAVSGNVLASTAPLADTANELVVGIPSG
jgi:hypothetical protein